MHLAASWPPPAWIWLPVMRWGLLAAALLWPTVAWAEGGAPPMDVAGLLRDGGPWGAVTVCAGIIWYLWSRLAEKDATIKELQDKRLADTASYIERISKVGTDASAAITGNNAQVADLLRLINAIFDLLKTVPPLVLQVKDETGINRGAVKELSDLIRDRVREHR